MEKNLPQIRSRAIVAAILFLIVSVSSMAQSQVGVNLSTKVALPYEWLGYDCPNVNKGSSFVEPNYVGHTPLLQPKVIRYPGNSSWFDWRRGWYSTSPLVPSKLSSLTRQPNYLENFKKVLDSCHADGMFTLNMITSNLQDQLALLKHADSIGIPVKYVELGAEFYIANTDPEAPEGSATVDSIFPFASAYAKVANVWIDSIHYHFPTAKVAIIGNFEKLSLGRDGTWNDSMRIYTSGREDAWTYHCYFKSNDNDTTVQIGMDDIKIWMGRPDLAMNILSNMSENKMTPGKESWITEYNNDDFTRPTCGRWAHGLYMGLFTLKCKEDTRITNLIAHAISGSAIYGQFFDGSTGFNISEAGDSTNASYVNPPTTSVYGLTRQGVYCN